MLNFDLDSETYTSLYLPNARLPQAYGALVPTKTTKTAAYAAVIERTSLAAKVLEML